MAEVNLKNVLSETTDQDNGEDGSHGLKKKKNYPASFWSKKGQISQEKTRKRHHTYPSSQSLYPPRGRKRKSKKQSKKRKKEIS